MISRKKVLPMIFVLSLVIANGQSASTAKAFETSYKQEATGEYTQAAKTLKAIYNEGNYEINLRLGWLNYSAGLFSESISYYQKAINLKTNSIEAKLGYVYPAAALNDWDKVILQYKNILEIDAQNSIANYRLGSIYYTRMEYSKSYDCLEKVTNLYPFDYDGLILFAWVNFQLGKHQEAKILFQKVILLNPGDESAKIGLEMIKM